MYFFLPLLVNAKTVTYDICKKDCEYNSILVVWHEINQLNEDSEVIINFKDQATYTFMDWDNMWIIDEEENTAHIYNEHIKKVTINGNKDSNTTIDVITIDNDTIREMMVSGKTKFQYKASLYDYINERKILKKEQMNIAEIFSYAKMINLLNKDIIKLVEDYNLTNNYNVFEYVKNNKAKVINLSYIYMSKYNYFSDYDENINYLEKLLQYLNSIGRTINDDNTCSYYKKNEIVNIKSTKTCNDIIESYNFFNSYIKSIISVKQEEFNTIISKYNDDLFLDIVNEENAKILLGENETIEEMLNFLNTGEIDYDKLLSLDPLLDYPYITSIMKGIIDLGIVDELSASDIEFIRLMFTGIFNADFEINNINFHGSPAFASAIGHVNGIINNSTMPFLLLVGGDVELHIYNSIVNRVYALGTDANEKDYEQAEYCNGINMCGNAKVYLDETNTILRTYRRIDLNTITNYGGDLLQQFTETLLQGDPIYDENEYNKSGFDDAKENPLAYSTTDRYGNTCYTTLISFCYNSEENSYYRYEAFREYGKDFREDGMLKNVIYILDTAEKFLNNSVLVELEGGKIYLKRNKSIKISINNQMSLKEIFAINDIEFDKVEWEIEDDTIAKIQDGKVVALRKGKTKMIANYAGDIYELYIEVENPIKNPETKNQIYLIIIAMLLVIITFYIVFSNEITRIK